jgi:hypothetical protein
MSNWTETYFGTELLGHDSDGQLITLKTSEALASKKLIGIYFSAHW